MLVEVTWVNCAGRYEREVLRLAPYDAPVKSYLGTLLDHEDSESIKRDGFVLFEDDEGMWCLHANQIKGFRLI